MIGSVWAGDLMDATSMMERLGRGNRTPHFDQMQFFKKIGSA